MRTLDPKDLRLFEVNPSEVTLEEAPLSFEEIEAELKTFEAAERRRLGIAEESVSHWTDPNPSGFRKDQREETTILCGGLTQAQDILIRGALRGLGYHIEILDVPDNDALRVGKEFGNRGQCNPTYFTVGNLVKHLQHLRDAGGMSVEEIVRTHLFFTAGSCGPCRFGTYVTEYRKALRDAGFDGFRVMLFQQKGGLKQATGENDGLGFDPPFFIGILKAILVGDALNAVGYRIRPYEVEPGSTNLALEECKRILHDALLERKSLLVALWKCRQTLSGVKVNRLQPKPKVTIIGEFWAMTTEGDGNYKLQQFLESEGAEVDVQLVTAWLLYMTWQAKWDTRRRMDLKEDDSGRSGLEGKNPLKKLLIIRFSEIALKGAFALYSKIIGLRHYHLPDMSEIATISHQYYDNHLRGGEGHMEIGKLIQSVTKKKAHMVVSVKPFGCMPSSGVSDGVQSLITARYPEAIFSAIETTGDGAANVQSRLQMDLFKARQVAKKELEESFAASGLSLEEAKERLERKGRGKALDYPDRGGLAGTAARLVAEVG